MFRGALRSLLTKLVVFARKKVSTQMFASYLEHFSYFCGVNTRARLRKHVASICVMKLWNMIKNEF